MQKLRKALAISVMSVTVLSTSMFSVSFAGAATSIAAGDLIKTNSSSAVYYVGADMKKNVFPDSTTYFSWYSDFSSVTVVSQDEFNALSWGGNVVMRPGTKLVKIQSDPRVYAVEPGGKMKHIPSEAVAISIYGADWAKRVVDISDTVFVSAYDKNPTELTTAFPAGSLVKDGGAAVYYFDGTNYRKIANEAAFYANRFSFDNLVTTTSAITASGSDVTSAEFGSVVAGGTADVVVGGSGLTVALASDSPEAGNIPAGSPSEFLKFNLTASNDGAVKISAITLSAYDLGTATYIDDVTFYDNGVKVGTSKGMTSDRVASFNFSTPIEVAAGATKSLTVKATIEAGQSGNFAIGVANAAAITTAGGATVSGSFPIQGKTKSIVTGTSIGTATMSAATKTTDATAKFGEDNVLVGEFTMTAANEPIIWSSARLKNGGTNNDAIAANFKLLIDGNEKATADAMVDKYVSFNLNNFEIAKGDSVNVEIYADMGIAGAGDTLNLYVDAVSDFDFTGKDYGYGVVLVNNANIDASGDGITVTLSTGDFTIDADKSLTTGTPAKDIRIGTDNVVLATIKLNSAGENVTIASIRDNGADDFVIAGTGLMCNTFENAELRDKDTGVVYDMTIASSGLATANTCELAMVDEVALVKGVTKTFEVRVDMMGSTESYPADANDTLAVTLKSTALSVTGDESDAAITDITPSSVTGSTITVKASSLKVAETTLAAKTIVTGASNVEIFQANLEAGASSYVDLTSVKISATSTGVKSFTDNNITKLDLYIDGKLVSSKSGQIVEGTATPSRGYINFTNLDTTNRRIAAGAKVVMVVKATFASTFTAPTGLFELGLDSTTDAIVARDMDNNNVVESGITANVASRAVTLATIGNLKTELLTTDSKANSDVYLLAGSTKTSGDAYVGEVKFTALNESVKVKTLILGNSGTATSNDIKAINLYNAAGTVVASTGVTASGHAVFTDLTLTIPADSSASYFVGVQAKSIGAEGDAEGTATHGTTVEYTLASAAQLASSEIDMAVAVEADGVDSNQTITLTEATSGTVANDEYASAGYATSSVATISGAILTSVVNTMTDGTLTGGAGKTIGKYKFVFDNGANRYSNAELKAQLVELQLTVATSSAIVTGVQAYIDGDSTNKTAAVEAATGVATIDLSSGLADSSQVDGEITLVITGTVSGVGSNAYVQTSIANLGATGDFTYDGDGNGTPVGVANSLLPISEVIGATLSN